ncbi:MAG: ligase-associated DNA damage response endonuclease PdeM [Flavobacteriales bacterium]
MNSIQMTTSTYIDGIEIHLNSLKFIFIPKIKTLLCADLHIGKAAHFRNHGVPIPVLANQNNFWNLSTALDLYKPNQLIVLGDLFHSTENIEWNDFTDFLDNYPKLQRVLVRGNHEVYFDSTYQAMHFDVHDVLQIDNFILSHEPLAEIPKGFYNLCGHMHPAVRLVGHARQSIRLPCFWFSKNMGVLPACGEFTGMHTVRPKSGDRLFVVAGNKLIEKLA